MQINGALPSRKVPDACQLLVAAWLSGLTLGTLFAAGLDDSYYALMRRLAVMPVSIVLFLIWAILPFLISAYAVLIHKQTILLCLCFAKAFCFSLAAFSFQTSFGSAGWLLQPMLQFSDLALMPMLCWICLRNCRQMEKTALRDHGICLCGAIAAALIGYTVTVPFAVELINHSSGR